MDRFCVSNRSVAARGAPAMPDPAAARSIARPIDAPTDARSGRT